MKLKIVIILLFIFTTFNLISQEKVHGGILPSSVNSDFEDYGAYMKLGEETDTLFFTSSRPTKQKKKIALSAEMFFSTRPSSERMSGMINEGWSKAKQIIEEKSRFSEFTRGALTFNQDETKIVFAAERDLTSSESKGTSYLLDLYEMYLTPQGFTKPKPLTALNDDDYWDSQPALSPDGKVIFFVSNRPGGAGGLDIWYSYQNYLSKWSIPQPVPNINTPGNEYSPHFGADGYFYFSSNWNYADNAKGEKGKDIFRADFENENGILLPANPIEMDEAIAVDAKRYGISVPEGLKLNSDKDDEFPYITKDRRFIFITSNRDADYEKRNLFAYALPKSRIRLQVNVYETILDADGSVIKEQTMKKDLALTIIDKETDAVKEINSGKPYEVEADRTYQIQFSKFVAEECYSNKISGPQNLEIKTFRPFGKDTLFEEDVFITRRKVNIPPIVFNSTDTLPYFITGYWYPNTSENIEQYRKREAEGFFDKTGFVDSTGYNYNDIAPLIDDSFKKQLYFRLEEVLPAFQDFCRDTLYLKVTVHGYTDPRGLSGGEDHPYRPQSKGYRLYPDKTITVGVDERGQAVKIPTDINMLNYNWPLDPENKDGRWIKLPDKGQMGNILLSKLRAYFTFETFDKSMIQRSRIYEQLRKNSRVIVDIEGFGIDKKGYEERGLRDDPQSRRIEIYLDILRPEEIDKHKRLSGGKLSRPTVAQKVKAQDYVVEDDIVMEEKSVEQEEIEVTEDEKVEELELMKDPQIEEEQEEFETEDEYSDDDEILEKYKDVEADNTAVKPEPVENVTVNFEAEQKRSCYKIYYKSYENKVEAFKYKKALEAVGLEDARVVEIFDSFGNNPTYELYSGCYSTAQDAMKDLKTQTYTIELLKLKRKPIIIR